MNALPRKGSSCHKCVTINDKGIPMDISKEYPWTFQRDTHGHFKGIPMDIIKGI